MTQDKTDDQRDSHQEASRHTYFSMHHSETDTESNIASDLEAFRSGSASSTERAGGSLDALKPSSDTKILADPSSTQVAADGSNEFRTGRSGTAPGIENPSGTLRHKCKGSDLNSQGEAEGTDEPKLSPDSFKSLAEAFQSSLHVVRCLRTALHLLNGTKRCDARTWETQGNQNDDEQQRVPPDAAVTAAKLIASQEAFVAEEAAYAGLLGEAIAGRPVPEAGASLPPEEKSAAEATDTYEAAATGTYLVAEASSKGPAPQAGDVLAAGKKSTEPSTVSSGGSIKVPNALEYELSVCKALLLLQQLTPSGLTTEEILTPSCPPLATSLLFDRPTSVLDKKARTESAARRNEAASKLVLDALLRVRLLQGTQQLLRADFLKLLHEQRRQHQQLQQAVQATVTKLGTVSSDLPLRLRSDFAPVHSRGLAGAARSVWCVHFSAEAERDTLLGRMRKLSAVVNRK
ncbi:hypothetical protein Emag_004530 [Eimeria magna]